MFSFPLRRLKRHLPLVDDVVTIRFLAEVPRYFTWIYGCHHERFGVFVNIFMKPPFEFAWAFPKFDGISVSRVEELPQFTKNCSSVNLERMRFTIEDFLCRVDRVCYDDNLGDVVDGRCLVDTASNSE